MAIHMEIATVFKLEYGLQKKKWVVSERMPSFATFFGLGTEFGQRASVQTPNNSERGEMKCTMPSLGYLQSGMLLEVKPNQRSDVFLLLWTKKKSAEVQCTICLDGPGRLHAAMVLLWHPLQNS